MKTICPICGGKVNVTDISVQTEHNPVTGIDRVCLICPACGFAHTVMITTPEIRKAMQDARQARAVMQATRTPAACAKFRMLQQTVKQLLDAANNR